MTGLSDGPGGDTDRGATEIRKTFLSTTTRTETEPAGTSHLVRQLRVIRTDSRDRYRSDRADAAPHEILSSCGYCLCCRSDEWNYFDKFINEGADGTPQIFVFD